MRLERVGNGSRRGSAVAEQLARCRGIICLILALACQKCWLEVATVSSLLSFPALGLDRHAVFFLTEGATMLLAALFASRLRALLDRGAFYSVMGTLLAASMILSLFANLPGAPTALLTVAGALVGGIAASILYLAIMALLCVLGPVLAVVVYLLGTILSFYFIVVCYALPQEVLPAIALLLSVVPYIALWGGSSCLRSDEAAIVPKDERMPHGAWKVLVLLSVMGFVFSLQESGMGNALFASGSMSAIGSHIVEAAFFLGIVFLGDRFHYVTVVRFALPVTALLFLFMPTNTLVTKAVSDVSGAAFYSLVTIYGVFTLFVLCSRHGYSPLRLFGLVFGAHNLCTMLGNLVTQLATYAAISPEMRSYLLLGVALLAMGYMFYLVVGGDAFSLWPRSFDDGAAPADPEEARRIACRLLAEEHGLTAREEEIVGLLAEGLSFPEIQEKLCLAEGTMKTHRRNIYAKCGVHSREALIDLL